MASYNPELGKYKAKETHLLNEARATAVGATAVAVGAAELPDVIGAAGLTLANGLDGLGILIPVLGAIPTFRRIRRLRKDKPKMPGGLSSQILKIRNLGRTAEEMRPHVEEWREKNYTKVSEDLDDSEKAERKKGRKAIWYPLTIGVLRSAVVVAQEIPHKGNVFLDFPNVIGQVHANPQVLTEAFNTYVHSSGLTTPTLAVMAGAFIGSISALLVQKAETGVHKEQLRMVNEKYRELNRLIADDIRSGPERIFDAARTAAKQLPDTARQLPGAARRVAGEATSRGQNLLDRWRNRNNN